MTTLRLGGDRLPLRLLSVALEWSADRLGTVVGGCVLLSPRHQPTAWAWGSAHPSEVDSLAPIAEWLHHLIFPPDQVSTLAGWAEEDPTQPSVMTLGRDDLRGSEGAPERLGIACPLVIVLRVEGRVAGLIWLAREASASPVGADEVRPLRLVQPLLELALRDRWYQDGTGATVGGELADRGLTPREEVVAALAIEGLGNGAIADRLHLSERTVRNHMTRVLAKCGVRTRTQLIALFATSG